MESGEQCALQGLARKKQVNNREVKQMNVYGNLCCYTHKYTHYWFILYLVLTSHTCAGTRTK